MEDIQNLIDDVICNLKFLKVKDSIEQNTSYFNQWVVYFLEKIDEKFGEEKLIDIVKKIEDKLKYGKW